MAKEDKNKKNSKDSQKPSFFKGLRAELKRVSWPTFKQVVNNTVAVITIVLVVAVVVFVLDFIFGKLNTYGVGTLKALVTSSSSEEEHVDDNTTEENLVQGALNEVQTEVVESTTEGQFVDAEAQGAAPAETPTTEATAEGAQPAGNQ